jgi:hypothetical protein
VENPGTGPSMRHRSLRVMAAMSASTLQAPLEAEREGVLQLRTQGLGVIDTTRKPRKK